MTAPTLTPADLDALEALAAKLSPDSNAAVVINGLLVAVRERDAEIERLKQANAAKQNDLALWGYDGD